MRRANLSKHLYGLFIFIFVICLFPVFPLAANGAVTIIEYPIPTSKSLPNGITSGPDGAIWFIEYSANQIGRIDPTTHAITEYAIPTPNSGASQSITRGSDGALWFTEGAGMGDGVGANQIGRIDPTTHLITEYAIPTPSSGAALITSGPDGALWFTEQCNQIGRIDPTTHAITEYAVPTPGSDPWGITAGPDGALWFTEASANQIGRIDPRTHEITEFYITDSPPGQIMSGPDGALWFDLHKANQIARFDITTQAVTEYTVPSKNSNPNTPTLGPDGALWFTELYTDKIGRIDPTTHAITEYAVPTAKSYPAGMTLGPDGALWFTEAYGNKIGRLVLASAPGAPTNVKATPTGVGQATVNCTAPSVTGGSSLTYTATSKPGGLIGTGPSPITVKGLNNDTAYTFTVTATNKAGLSATSKASNKITTWAVPGQPSITSLTAGNDQVTVKFTAPKSSGGTPITGYTVTAYNAGVVAAGSTDEEAGSASVVPHTVDNLQNGTKYTFTVTATNAVGSTTSKPSKPITIE
jgi:virginiamycin B lyase